MTSRMSDPIPTDPVPVPDPIPRPQPIPDPPLDPDPHPIIDPPPVWLAGTKTPSGEGV